MPTYYGNASVYGGKHLGEVEADTPEEAYEKLSAEAGPISLCHQCSGECEDGEAVNIVVSDDAGNVVYQEDESGDTCVAALAVLRELVTLKEMHDREMTAEEAADYATRKPAAWDSARKLLGD